jgi:predicted ATPase
MIEEIRVQNFKSFGDTTISLSNLNLLTGINGVGKSTLIQALLLVRQSFTKNVFPKKGIVLNGDLVSLGKGSDVLNIHSEKPEISFCFLLSGNLKIEIALKFIGGSDFLPIIKSKSKIPADALKSALFTSKFKYLSAERVSPKVSYDVSLFEVEENRSLGIHGEHTSLFIAKYQRMPVVINSLIHKGSTSNSLIQQISLWLQDISPGINLSSQYYPEIDSAKVNYQYEYKGQVTPEFRPTNVGFGVTYVLPIITVLLSAEKGDIVVIENPEAHLHPSGQSKLGEMFFMAAIGGVQTIIETHSDHVLNGIRVAINKYKKYSRLVNLFYFERDKFDNKHSTCVVSPRIDNNGRINNWPEGFFDEWDKSIMQLL